MIQESGSDIRAMEYPLLPGPRGTAFSAALGMVTDAESDAVRRREFAQQLETVRRQAIDQGKQMAADESAAWRQQCSDELAKAVETFRAARDAYLAQVEKEVVSLALAIAERILHRESQLDPLLLSGAMRQALNQLGAATDVRLRVPEEQLDLWTEMVRLMPALPLRPQVVADPELSTGAVLLESSLGRADLSIGAQLDEIERGFFDREEATNHRPPLNERRQD